ncbi:hypothetical protein [Methylobacterium sp. P5_C11]
MNNIEREETNDVALKLMARAFHALAIFYEIKCPTDYNYFDRKIIPYLIEISRIDSTHDADGAMRTALALDRVRALLNEVGTDVAAIRSQILVEG